MVKIMGKVRIEQVRSTIGRPERQKRTIEALGLGKINRQVEVELTPSIQGMINKVSHLVSVTEL
jgi:large subunit ribosomal protein L30